jgi:hypothetical protein
MLKTSRHMDPEGYVKWLERQRMAPWIDLARSLDAQSRYS